MQIEWRKLIDSVFLDKISANEEFIVKVPSFIADVDRLLKRTDSRYDNLLHHSFCTDWLSFEQSSSQLPHLQDGLFSDSSAGNKVAQTDGQVWQGFDW